MKYALTVMTCLVLLFITNFLYKAEFDTWLSAKILRGVLRIVFSIIMIFGIYGIIEFFQKTKKQ